MTPCDPQAGAPQRATPTAKAALGGPVHPVGLAVSPHRPPNNPTRFLPLCGPAGWIALWRKLSRGATLNCRFSD